MQLARVTLLTMEHTGQLCLKSKVELLETEFFYGIGLDDASADKTT